jgi:hypothetical protein
VVLPTGVIEQLMTAGRQAGDHITWTMVWRPLKAGIITVNNPLTTQRPAFLESS